jgi:hypothetical protein
MYDVAGVLWPAGYLLGLCLSDPVACGFPEAMNALNSKHPVALELGAGVGFPSIAFAKALKHHHQAEMDDTINVSHQSHNSPVILATDTSNVSLSLITSNAHTNGVGDMVMAFAANHSDPNSLSSLSQKVLRQSVGTNERRDGFDIIFGSSLQSLFDETSQQSAA